MSTLSPIVERSYSRISIGVLRKVFSFPVMLVALLSLLAVLTVRSRFDDPDMWWHMKTGQIIWTTHSLPTTDVFSYTTGHHAYVPHEWLAQLMIYAAYRFGGYSGLMLWLCLLTSGLLLAGYLLCALYSGNAKVAFLGAMTIWLFATIGLAVRPQMIGYLLLTVELLLLQLGRTRSPRWFLALPLLFALWVNCHGSFLFGLILAATLLFCSFCEFRAGSLLAMRWEPRRRRMLAWALLLSLAALFLNPVGIRQILYPLNTMLHQPVGTTFVDEWMPLRMSGARGIALMAVLLCVFLMTVARRAELFFDELMLLGIGVWLAVSHERMLFVFGILAAPILSRFLSTCWEGYDAARDRPWANAAMIAVSVFIMVRAFPTTAYLAQQVEEHSPVRAVEYLKAHPISGNMLNDYSFGGYLIWALPEHPVFVDGRADVFEWTGVLASFGKWAMLQDDPTRLLNKHDISFCLLSATSPMSHVIPFLPGWKQIYSDHVAVIFKRTAR